MALSFYNAFDLPVTVVRPFNTYGPRQSARAIIPTIISQIASGMKQIKLGDLTPTRDFNFVLDICRWFLAIADTDQTIGHEVNIASNSEISMGNALDLIISIMGKEIEVISDKERIRPENSEVFRLFGDNTLIRKLTKWEPEYTLEEGLKITIEWISKPKNLAKYKPEMYNL